MNVYEMRAGTSEEGWMGFDQPQSEEVLPYRTDVYDERPFLDYFRRHPTMPVERFVDEGDPSSDRFKLPDSTIMGHALEVRIFSARVAAVLQPLLQSSGVWVDLDFDEADYKLFWLSHFSDALDVSKSKLRYFENSDRLWEIEQHVFLPERLQGELMFHLPQMGFKMPLCTDSLVDLVAEHRWTGFHFVPIWSSKRGPIARCLRPGHWLTGLETTSVREALVG